MPILYFIIPNKIKVKTYKHIQISLKTKSSITIDKITLTPKGIQSTNIEIKYSDATKTKKLNKVILVGKTKDIKRQISISKKFSNDFLSFALPKKVDMQKDIVTLKLLFSDKKKCYKESKILNVYLSNHSVSSFKCIDSIATSPINNAKEVISSPHNVILYSIGNTRRLIYLSTINMISKKPWVGYGPKTWRKFVNDINHNDFAYLYLHFRDNDHFYGSQ